MVKLSSPKPLNKRQKTGIKGQKIAEMIYAKDGHKILYKNFRTRFGEIDLVTKLHNQIYVIEIKVKNQKDYGDAFEKWMNSQRLRLSKAVKYLIATEIFKNQDNINCEFIEFDLSGISKVKFKRYKNIPL